MTGYLLNLKYILLNNRHINTVLTCIGICLISSSFTPSLAANTNEKNIETNTQEALRSTEDVFYKYDGAKSQGRKVFSIDLSKYDYRSLLLAQIKLVEERKGLAYEIRVMDKSKIQNTSNKQNQSNDIPNIVLTGVITDNTTGPITDGASFLAVELGNVDSLAFQLEWNADGDLAISIFGPSNSDSYYTTKEPLKTGLKYSAIEISSYKDVGLKEESRELFSFLHVNLEEINFGYWAMEPFDINVSKNTDHDKVANVVELREDKSILHSFRCKKDGTAYVNESSPEVSYYNHTGSEVINFLTPEKKEIRNRLRILNISNETMQLAWQGNTFNYHKVDEIAPICLPYE